MGDAESQNQGAVRQRQSMGGLWACFSRELPPAFIWRPAPQPQRDSTLTLSEAIMAFSLQFGPGETPLAFLLPQWLMVCTTRIDGHVGACVCTSTCISGMCVHEHVCCDHMCACGPAFSDMCGQLCVHMSTCVSAGPSATWLLG